MKLDKKKLGLGLVIGAVVIFMIVYALSAFGSDDKQINELLNPLVPEIETESQQYDNKLVAIDDLKEVRESNAPSIYDEKLIDSTGLYDPDLLDKIKKQKVDSILNSGRIDYTTGTYRDKNITEIKTVIKSKPKVINYDSTKKAKEIQSKEIALNQQLFFAVAPSLEALITATIPVVVDGVQVIKTNDRLTLRVSEDCFIGKVLIPKNTLVYGIVSFAPNRVFLSVHIASTGLSFKGYDYDDRLEGIYIKNSFREEATREVVDDAIGDINVPGIPQVGVFKRLFQRSNRSVKVIAGHNYKLILKADSRQ